MVCIYNILFSKQLYLLVFKLQEGTELTETSFNQDLNSVSNPRCILSNEISNLISNSLSPKSITPEVAVLSVIPSTTLDCESVDPCTSAATSISNSNPQEQVIERTLPQDQSDDLVDDQVDPRKSKGGYFLRTILY